MRLDLPKRYYMDGNFLTRGWARLTRYSNFSPRLEALHLLMPVVFIGIGLAMGVHRQLLETDRGMLLLVVNVIFGNGFHIMFSFWNFRNSAEYRNVSRELGLRAWHFVAILIGLVTFFVLFHDLSTGFRWWNFRIVATWLVCLIPAVHVTRQSMGLSLMYNMNRREDLAGAERERFVVQEGKSRWWEHRAASLLVTGLFVINLGHRPIRYRYLPELTTMQIGVGLNLIGLVCLGIALWHLRRHRALQGVKVLFAARYVLYPLAAFSFFTYALTSACHGTESVLLQKHITKRSPSLKAVTLGAVIPLALLIVLMTVIDLFSQTLTPEPLISDFVTDLAVVTGTSLTYLHYLMDSIYFRMRVPVIRAEILPLLVRESSAGSLRETLERPQSVAA